MAAQIFGRNVAVLKNALARCSLKNGCLTDMRFNSAQNKTKDEACQANRQLYFQRDSQNMCQPSFSCNCQTEIDPNSFQSVNLM